MRGFRRAPRDTWLEAPETPAAATARAAEPESSAARADAPRRRWPGTKLGIAIVLGLVAAVSAAGIVGGRALTPAVRATIPTASVPAPAPPKPRPRGPHWGPLAVKVVARFAAQGSSGGSAAAFAGGRLVVIAGVRDESVFAGKLGGELARVANLAAPHESACAFASGPSVYLIGGEGGAQPNDLIIRIDPVSGHAFYGGVFGEPIAECGVAASAAGSYLVGGWTGQKYATAILPLGASGALGLLGRLPGGVRFPAVAFVGRRIYVAGGRTQAGLSRQIFAIDTRTGAVDSLGQLPHALERALLVVSGSSLYLLGGEAAAGRALSSIVRIDPANGTTSAAGRLPQPLAGAASVEVGGHTLVVDPAAGLVYRVG
jgi:hypothetical protein